MTVVRPAVTLIVAAVLALGGSAAIAGPLKVGDASLLVLEHESASESSNGSSSSSGGTDVLVARILSVSDDGMEIEYDAAPPDGEEARAGDWHLPVRIFWPTGGQPRILNRDELAARVDPWLAKLGATRDACGKWIFTWNAFLIDCDPETALSGISRFDLGSVALHEGLMFDMPDTLDAAPLVALKDVPGTSGFTAEQAIDPEAVRARQIENDLIVAQITGDALTREDAVARHADEQITGSVRVTIETDPDGYPIKRTTVSKVRTTKSDGSFEDAENRATLTREPLAEDHSSTV